MQSQKTDGFDQASHATESQEAAEEMKELQVPEFRTYEEEAAFWDNLDTADFMEDDGE